MKLLDIEIHLTVIMECSFVWSHRTWLSLWCWEMVSRGEMAFGKLLFLSNELATYSTRFWLKTIRKLSKICILSKYFIAWDAGRVTSLYTIHSNSKFRVSATEAFRRTTFTEVSSSKFWPKTSGYGTETSGFRTETSGFRTETSGFRTETSGFWTETSFFLPETSCCWKPEFRVFKPKLFVLQRIFFRPTETSGVDSGIFATKTSEYQIHTKIF
jgi:hypothetical protein